MSSSVDEAALLERLTRIALYRRFNREDACDLAMETVLRTLTWRKSASTPPAPAEFEKYAFTVLRNLMVDFWQSPARRIGKRLNHLLAKHPDVFWSAKVGQDTVIGLTSQPTPASGGSSAYSDSVGELSQYLYSDKGLSGKTPSDCSTKKLVHSLLRWHGAPLTRTCILGVLSSIVVLPTTTISLDPEQEPSVEPPTLSNLGSHIWQLLKTLPYRMKTVLLLSLDTEAAHVLGAKDQDLQAELPEWSPPPAVTVDGLPISDDILLEKLSITRENLHTIRCRARRLLQAKFPEEMAL